MSEPISTNKPNVDPYRIELPNPIVTARMVPHHLADENGGIARTGKIEVRIENPITKNDAKKTVDWHATAMNCAHQTAYYKQVYDNIVMRAEDAERKYADATRNYGYVKTELARLGPIISGAFSLKSWWGFFLLPKSFKRLIAAKLV